MLGYGSYINSHFGIDGSNSCWRGMGCGSSPFWD